MTTYLTQQQKWALECAVAGCSHCGAEAGEPCLTLTGEAAGKPHMPRLMLAREGRRSAHRILNSEEYWSRRAEQLLTGQEP